MFSTLMGMLIITCNQLKCTCEGHPHCYCGRLAKGEHHPQAKGRLVNSGRDEHHRHSLCVLPGICCYTGMCLDDSDERGHWLDSNAPPTYLFWTQLLLWKWQLPVSQEEAVPASWWTASFLIMVEEKGAFLNYNLALSLSNYWVGNAESFIKTLSM